MSLCYQDRRKRTKSKLLDQTRQLMLLEGQIDGEHATFHLSRHASSHGDFLFHARLRSRLFELALVFVRLDHVARFIVNANHGIV